MKQLELAILKRNWCEAALPLFQLIPSGTEFTSDDLHRHIPTTPEHPNWWGVLLAKCRALRLATPIGYTPSSRPEANGRVIRLWKKS